MMHVDRLVFRLPESSLLRFVRLSSERASQAVRQDCSVAKKQEPPPALLVVVHRRHLRSQPRGDRFAPFCESRARTEVWTRGRTPRSGVVRACQTSVPCKRPGGSRGEGDRAAGWRRNAHLTISLGIAGRGSHAARRGCGSSAGGRGPAGERVEVVGGAQAPSFSAGQAVSGAVGRSSIAARAPASGGRRFIALARTRSGRRRARPMRPCRG
jgi:hypothetical protein